VPLSILWPRILVIGDGATKRKESEKDDRAATTQLPKGDDPPDYDNSIGFDKPMLKFLQGSLDYSVLCASLRKDYSPLFDSSCKFAILAQTILGLT